MEDRHEGVSVLERTNGTAAPATERPNPLARRTEWCALGDGYPTYEVLIWTNPRNRKQTTEPKPGDQGVLAKLTTVVLDHRCKGPDGEWMPWPHPDQPGPMPSPSTPEFFDLLTDDALEAICRHVQAYEKKAFASVARIFAGSTDTLSAGILPSAAGPNGSPASTS